ncbi:MAG: hypothetical protein U0838_02160 [Chloroflexota bacterium]
MIEVAVYLAIVLVIGGLGVWIGIIVAGRIDRRMTPPDAEPADPPPTEEPS